MNIIGIIIWSVWGICVILSFYLMALGYTMRAILDKNKIKTNYFSFYWSFKLFKDFIEENEFEDSVRMKYVRLYKKAIWTKRILLCGVLCFILFPIILTILTNL